MIPFGPWEPDRLSYAAGISITAINCLPLKDGWGPMPKVVPFSEALPAPCRGAVFARTSSSSYRIFAGTADGLYEYNITTRGWDDISGTTYSLPANDRWWFVNFGANLIAGQIGNPPQFIDIDVGTAFANLAGSPPNARYAWRAGAQLVLGNLVDHPNRVMTSGLGNAEYWTAGSLGCDFQDFPDGEEVCGGIGAQGGALIFQKSAIRSMSMLSGDVAFRTDVLNANRGVVAPLSIAQVGPGQFFYLSQDGFFANIEGQAIGLERVDRWVFGQLDKARIQNVRALVDPLAKIVWWQVYRTTGMPFLIGYRWPMDRWCYSNASFTEVANLVTTGISIDGMDYYYASIDAVTEPFDSVLFTGGVPSLAVFDADNRMCYVSGSPMEAIIETADTQLTPGARSRLSKARVVTDATDYTLSAVTSDFHGGSKTTGSPVEPYPATGICHFRSSALTHGFRLEIADGASWSHATGIDFPDGGFMREGQR